MQRSDYMMTTVGNTREKLHQGSGVRDQPGRLCVCLFVWRSGGERTGGGTEAGGQYKGATITRVFSFVSIYTWVAE